MTAIGQWFREEGKVETPMAALEEGSSVEFVGEITGMLRETILRLKSKLEPGGIVTRVTPGGLKP